VSAEATATPGQSWPHAAALVAVRRGPGPAAALFASA
jgi:hypothetical protein